MSEDLAFERFVREYTPALFGTAFVLTGNRHEAEELLQDTLARLYPATVMAAESPIACVRRSVVNRYLSLRRPPVSRTESHWEAPDRR